MTNPENFRYNPALEHCQILYKKLDKRLYYMVGYDIVEKQNMQFLRGLKEIIRRNIRDDQPTRTR